jgi:hypothetical protein
MQTKFIIFFVAILSLVFAQRPKDRKGAGVQQVKGVKTAKAGVKTSHAQVKAHGNVKAAKKVYAGQAKNLNKHRGVASYAKVTKA